jgi:hypothetical protein
MSLNSVHRHLPCPLSIHIQIYITDIAKNDSYIPSSMTFNATDADTEEPFK